MVAEWFGTLGRGLIGHDLDRGRARIAEPPIQVVQKVR